MHNKLFDGTCDMCINGLDMICRNGGLIGGITNGGFAEVLSYMDILYDLWIHDHIRIGFIFIPNVNDGSWSIYI